MCKHGTTVPMPINGRVRDIDHCIAYMVAALNAANITTIASCCGHGHRPGTIILEDGRWLFIAKDRAEAEKIDAIFPLDIHGNRKEQPMNMLCTCEGPAKIGPGYHRPGCPRFLLPDISNERLSELINSCKWPEGKGESDDPDVLHDRDLCRALTELLYRRQKVGGYGG